MKVWIVEYEAAGNWYPAYATVGVTRAEARRYMSAMTGDWDRGSRRVRPYIRQEPAPRKAVKGKRRG